jgi:hypothetical protein
MKIGIKVDLYVLAKVFYTDCLWEKNAEGLSRISGIIGKMQKGSPQKITN